VLDHGREFESQPRPKGFRRRGASQACFYNAYRLAEKHGLAYVEGFGLGLSGVLIHHAWCLDEAAKVIDTTWDRPESCYYYGIPFRWEFAQRSPFKFNRYNGVLMPDGFSFKSVDFDGIEFRNPRF
jgi:hypothetical protein